MNEKKYWLRTFGQYSDLRFSEWTSRLVSSMKFETEELAQTYRLKFFANRPTVFVDKQFDVYGAHTYDI